MENSNPDNSTIYPNLEVGPPQPQPEQPPVAVGAPKSFNMTTAAMILLLVLTFFTALGPALVLPLIIVAIVMAFKHTRKRDATMFVRTPTGEFIQVKRSAFGTFVHIMAIVFGVIGFGILALIGLFFIAIATGGADFRMGS